MIFIYVFLKNLFTRKNLRCIKVGKAYLLIHQQYDKVLADYYNYIVGLLFKQLVYLNHECIVLFEVKKPVLPSLFPPIYKINLQIEHTLAKRGTRDSAGGISGQIPVADGQENYLVRVANLGNLLLSDLVFEYSKINEANINIPELALYRSKVFCISPALYKIHSQSCDHALKRTIGTITLFGNPKQGRRKIFLEELSQAGVNFKNINNYFDGIENLYRDTRIIINIRQTDGHDTLEELRILPALRCGALVISEHAPLINLTRYSKYIIWGELSELPGLVLDVQNNYQYWHQKIFGDPGFLKRMDRISKRNELVSLEAIRQLSRRTLQ